MSGPKVVRGLCPCSDPRGWGLGPCPTPNLRWMGFGSVAGPMGLGIGSCPDPRGLCPEQTGLEFGFVAAPKVVGSESEPKVVGGLGLCPDSRALGWGSVATLKVVGGLSPCPDPKGLGHGPMSGTKGLGVGPCNTP